MYPISSLYSDKVAMVNEKVYGYIIGWITGQVTTDGV